MVISNKGILMNIKILIVCVLVAGKSIESSWNSFQMSEPHDVHYRISCCKNALEKREAVLYKIDASTQGLTDDQYEYELRNIREAATGIYSAVEHQRNLLSRIQRNHEEGEVVEQLHRSLIDTIVSYLRVKSSFEKAQQARDARLGIFRQ